jgi:hypothetical protein
MAGTNGRVRPVLGLVVALLISVGWAAAPTPAEAALPVWRGGINLYQTGVFSTQKSWLWCTAASVQIMRNIKYHRADHSRSNQSLYFDYMRARNRYSLPLSAGVDPQGWTAGLQRFVDVRYRLVAADSFMGALRLAVTRMRKLSLPVALAVAHGNHGWVLHGFTATADPAKTTSYTITSIRVSGPLWGLQNSSFGYDMRPNTKLTVTQLKRFFTKWWYAPKRMIWDNKYVSIQPIPVTTTTSTTTAPVPAPVEPVSPAPSAAASAPIPSPVTVPPPEVAASAPAPATEPPAAALQTPLVADLVLVIVSGGLAVLVVLLVSRIGRSGSPGRRSSRLRDRRAGWSS